MRTDDTIVKANFCNAYISKLMRVKKGVVDIPVGDFKVSKLSEHPSLHVHGTPRVCFHRQMGKTYVFLSHWLWLFICLVSKKRHSVLKRTELQT